MARSCLDLLSLETLCAPSLHQHDGHGLQLARILTTCGLQALELPSRQRVPKSCEQKLPSWNFDMQVMNSSMQRMEYRPKKL